MRAQARGRARSCSARRRRRSSRTRTRAAASTGGCALPRADRRAGPADGRDRGPARGAASRRRPDPDAAAARGARRRGSRAASRRCCCSTAAATPRACSAASAGRRRLCPNCSVSLTLHQGGPRARAATTARHEARTPGACPSCQGAYLRLTGYGTEKVVEAVRRRFPRRAWSGSTATCAARRGALAQVLAAFEAGETRHPGRHADDRQGPRLPARHARGRDRRGRRARPARLPRRRAHVPAPDPGRGPRGARRTCRAR